MERLSTLYATRYPLQALGGEKPLLFSDGFRVRIDRYDGIARTIQ